MNKSKMKINPDGSKVWRNPQGQLHNEEGPAWIFSNDSKAWYIHNKTHRENGPARIFSDGEKIWYINGNKIIE